MIVEKIGKSYLIEKEWWKFLDWSFMKSTYKKLPKEFQNMLLKKAYWSLGKGIFYECYYFKCMNI